MRFASALQDSAIVRAWTGAEMGYCCIMSSETPSQNLISPVIAADTTQVLHSNEIGWQSDDLLSFNGNKVRYRTGWPDSGGANGGD